MFIEVGKRKIEIREYKKTIDRIKTLKFVLEPIDYGIKIPNKKIVNTYLFCQRVDICITNKEEKILALYENIKSEKIKIHLQASHIYYLPLNTCKNLKTGKKLVLKESK